MYIKVGVQKQIHDRSHNLSKNQISTFIRIQIKVWLPCVKAVNWVTHMVQMSATLKKIYFMSVQEKCSSLHETKSILDLNFTANAIFAKAKIRIELDNLHWKFWLQHFFI